MPRIQYQTPGVYIKELDIQQSLKSNLYHDVESTLSSIANELNKYLKTVFSSIEDRVVLSVITQFDGSSSPIVANKVVMQLINSAYKIDGIAEGDKKVKSKDKTYTILLSANFYNHPEALKQIGAVADFFQFACPQGTAKYIPNVSSLKIQALDYDINQMGEVFGLLKSPYIPSLAYQIVIPTFDIEILVQFKGKNTSTNLKQEIEDTIQGILQQFVFLPNSYPNWLTIKYLVDEYLYSVSNDSLFSNTLVEEYVVNIGLGETMTAEDILSGFLLLAVNIKFKDQEDRFQLTFKVQLAV